MKEKILDFGKGIPIGIANVIPGFSGGTMAIILGVYEKLINAFSDFFRHPLKVLKNAWALFLGVAVGIVIAIKLIVLLLSNFPIPTIMFFVGLIIGSIPNIFSKANQNSIKAIDIIICFLCIIIIIVFSFIKQGTPTSSNYDFKTILIVFFLAIAAAAAMVIPGVSGSLILLAFGYYDFIVSDLIGTFINEVLHINIRESFNTLLLLLPFIVGVGVGIVAISKLIKYFLAKYPQTIYFGILGLLVASPFAIIYRMYQEYEVEIGNTGGFWSWAIGITLIIISAYLVNYLSKFDNQKGI